MTKCDILSSSLLFVTALLSLAVAAVTWRRRHARGGRVLLFFLLATTWWSLTYAVFWASPAEHRQFWLDMTYVGVVSVAPAVLVFILQFTHREKWLNRPLLALLIAEPVITLIILWSDPWHGLFFAGLRDADASKIYTGGPWFWANILYTYILSSVAAFLLVKSTFGKKSPYSRQLRPVFLAVLIPWLASILSFLNLNPVPSLDLTPIAFMFTGITLTYTIFRRGFLDLIPVARDELIEKMRDGILVTDTQGRVIDYNPALVDILDLKENSVAGKFCEDFLPVWHRLQTDPEAGEKTGLDIPSPAKQSSYLNVRLIRLQDGTGEFHGNLLILRDISFRKQMESEREDLIISLKEALNHVKTLKGLLPICSHCKKIRDDKGYWQDVAVYVREHSEAEFSHSICPECMKEYYPGKHSAEQ